MKLGVFVPAGNPRHQAALAAFATGAQKTDEVFVTPDAGYRDCDVAVVFGTWKKAVPASWNRGRIIATHLEKRKRVVIIDTGYVKRDDYYMVGFDGLNGRADFNNQNSPEDRWRALSVALEPWRAGSGETIVVAGQIPWDASVQHSDHLGWCRSTIAQLNKRTNRPIVFRPHPLAHGVNYGALPCEISTRPLAEDLANAYAVVTYNSNVGVDATIAGIPAFAFDEGSMIWRVCNRDFAGLIDPINPAREWWAADLAYAQWNLDEMKEGQAWAHLRPVAIRNG